MKLTVNDLKKMRNSAWDIYQRYQATIAGQLNDDIGELLPKVRTLDITVELLNEVDGGIDGAQWYGEDNRQHYIEINKNLCYEDFVTAVMHEMVHVKQDYRKDKSPIEDREKEAYEQQEILFERWKNDINRKTNY